MIRPQQGHHGKGAAEGLKDAIRVDTAEWRWYVGTVVPIGGQVSTRRMPSARADASALDKLNEATRS
jgi:hypothetical protein